MGTKLAPPLRTYYPQLEIIEPLSPDGSQRRPFRGRWNGTPCVVFLPSPGESGRAEARAFGHIGDHLFRAGIPVPEILHFHPGEGIVVVRECPGIHLQEWANRKMESGETTSVLSLYKVLIQHQVEMAISGSRGFRQEWCWETPVYDAGFAFKKEGRYFLHWFGERLVKAERPLLNVLERELYQLSAMLDGIRNCFFLHRDFQSRNILVSEEGRRFWFIDFQGGRLGPMGYDAASLIFDPYLPFSWEERTLLASHFLDVARANGEEGPRLLPLAVFRLLQATGAFAKLGFFMGKPHFRPYLRPALALLSSLLRSLDEGDSAPTLSRFASEAAEGEKWQI